VSKFKASTIEPISWDVKGFAKLDPETGDLDGKWSNADKDSYGELPEPTPDQVQAYTAGYDEVMAMIRETPDDPELFGKIRAEVSTLLVNLGFPEALIKGLPPRLFRGLSDHVYGDLVEGN
jgi:hypothetical protein